MEKNKTKEKFEKALFKLLEDKKYHDITINEICAAANKTKMTFYNYYKDKDSLLTSASVNLINAEYNTEYEKILKKETDLEEIEYQSLIATFKWVTNHYNQILNLVYNGETLSLEIFKSALFDNYSKYTDELIDSNGYDIPKDYITIFCFEGLYHMSLYYAEQLRNSKNNTKVIEENKKTCRFLAKAIISAAHIK